MNATFFFKHRVSHESLCEGVPPLGRSFFRNVGVPAVRRCGLASPELVLKSEAGTGRGSTPKETGSSLAGSPQNPEGPEDDDRRTDIS